MTLPVGEESQISETTDWLAILQNVYQTGKAPETWPASTPRNDAWRKLTEDLWAIRQFINQLTQGDLSAEMRIKGQLAGSLKSFQANLRHLTWQVQQVAEGDLTQKVDFMGEFSAAFNQMTENLARARSELLASEAAEHDQRTLAEALRDTVADLNSAKNLDEVFDRLLENISRVVPHDTVDIILVDANGVGQVKASKGYNRMVPGKQELVYQLKMPVNQVPNLRQMAETRLPCLIDDLDEFQWVRTASTPWAKSHLGAPILVKGKAEGFFILLSDQKGFFTPEHAERLQSFANQAAIAIEKTWLIQELNELATTDPLTGISNRRHFFNQAEIELIRTQRYDRPLSALMLDIDHFKKVNDTYGHSIGDQVLQGVAQRCRRVLRKHDLLGRYGGEEFSILLPETYLPEGIKTAERLRQAIAEQPFETLKGSVEITVSIGAAGFCSGIPSAKMLLDLADKALYQAKQAGRNRVVALE